MKKIIFIFSLITFFHAASAQVVFKTITTKGPVVAGESFQVQFVLEDVDVNSEFYPPDFKDFRFVGGPYIYTGTAYGTDGPKQLKNIIYTLEAIKPGKFIIAGASAKVNSNLIKSDKIFLEVISEAEAVKRHLVPEIKPYPSNTASFLQPGEDPYKKIRKNLFIKVMVDKKSCFVGEPITATFKLYSRLESRSDIVKNPGFYGFTVQDMVGLEDNQVGSEMINGKKFDVHTVRMVQLYPLQAGSFTIDPMEIENKVRFSKSAVNDKTEQQIVEGIFPDNDAYNNPEGEIYENNMSTEAIAITVKPYPQKNGPGSFNGATGRFAVDAAIDKNKFTKNEEGHLTITISGKGNFTQLTAPVINWPAGMEGFESKTTDQLDIKKAPLTGKRIFKFPFVSAKPGHYTIPIVSFLFFDPDSGSYKIVSSKAIDVTIVDNKSNGAIADWNKDANKPGNYFLLWMAASALIIAAIIWMLRFKKTRKAKDKIPEMEKKPTSLSVIEILQPALSLQAINNKGFYALLRSCIWNFFSIHFGLSGSGMNRQNLFTVMQQKNVDEKNREDIMEILQQCETGIFTDANTELDRGALIKRTTAALEYINHSINS